MRICGRILRPQNEETKEKKNYHLVHYNVRYFLSRPRRFGKSLVFTLLGKFVHYEMHTYTGRIDCKVETRDYIYLFEFKRDDTAQAALKHIDSKDYALPFASDTRTLFKIGVSFDSATRKLVGWEVE